MESIKDSRKGNDHFLNTYRNICIMMVWCTVVYSTIIQYKLYAMQNGMMVFGMAVLFFYILAWQGKVSVYEVLTRECLYMLCFMLYMLLVGLFFSPNRSTHISQWVRCMEYLFIQIVIASIIQDTGTHSFHTLLFVVAVAFAILFLRNPVEYQNTGRYTISGEVNPNGLGMGFAAGIWAVLYRQTKKAQPISLTLFFIAMFCYCIMMTGSRKALIGAGLTVFLWLFFSFLPNMNNKGFGRGIISFALLIFLSYIISHLFISEYSNSLIASRMSEIFFEVSEGSRSVMYQEGYELIKSNPLFGFGFMGFGYYYKGYSHATLIEVPVSGGIIGSILYFAAYYISLKKQLIIYHRTKERHELESEHSSIKMILILYIVMVFYSTCIIHPYQFDSAVLFGIIFGETSYLESVVNSKPEVPIKKRGSKYLKYE